MVFALSAALAAGVIWREENGRLRAARIVLSSLAAERAGALQTSIERALSATHALAALVQQGNGRIPDFEATAAELLRLYPGAAALQLAPGGVVRQVEPLRGNEQSIGHDLLQAATGHGEPALARDSSQLLLAGPVDQGRGGAAAAGSLPVFLHDTAGRERFWGLVIVQVDIPAVLAASRLRELQELGYAYQLAWLQPTSREREVISASSPDTLVAPVERTFPVANGLWILRIAPLQGWGDHSGLWWQSAAAALFCLALAWQAAWQAKLVAIARAHERTLELRVAQRTADLQRFSEVTAHHLQEPARRVATYAGRLRAQLAGRIDDDEVRVSLDFISEQASRLQQLLRDVELYLAADQPRGKVESCAAERTLTLLLAKLADPIAEAGARVTVGKLPPALIDAPRLAELFRVALENALQHGRGERSLCIDIGGERLGAWVRYHVSDNGPGIEEEYRVRVFRVFERLSSGGEGTGIGLAILRRITESAGGHAWLEETPGGGCRLVLELPAGDAPPAGPE